MEIPDDAIEREGTFVTGWGAWKGVCPICGKPMMPSITNEWIACKQGHVFTLDKTTVKYPFEKE